MLTRERIDNFYIDLEALGLKRPVAAISKATGYSKGNVSEWINKVKEPSENFINKFYAVFYENSIGNSGAAQSNGTLTGSITVDDYKSEIEKRIAEIEARRRDAEAMYQDAKEEKKRLLNIIDANLTQLQINSKSTIAYLEKILLVDRADHETQMDSLDRIEHQPVGSNAKRAGKRELDEEARRRKRDKKNPSGVGK
jgi:hypothetical protein